MHTRWATEADITELPMDPFIRDVARRVLRGTWRVPSQHSCIVCISGPRTDPKAKATGRRQEGTR